MEPNIDRYRLVMLAVLCYERATEEALGPPTRANRGAYQAHVDRLESAGALGSHISAVERTFVADMLLAMAPVLDNCL
jgi:hypothetical protein